MFAEALALFREKKLSEARMAAIGFVCLGEHFHGVNFIQSSGLKRVSSSLLVESDSYWGELFLESKFKCIKAKAGRALGMWLSGDWNLALLHHIPSVYEVLSLQAQGRRCVTLFTEQSQWGQPKLAKENALHFFVHDLEHAVQFYDYFHADQVSLNDRLLKMYDQGHFSELMKTPFEERLDYLLSDMNTHPQHSHQFLEAIWHDYARDEQFVAKKMALLIN